MLLFYHPLFIYRIQVIKQADVVLSMLLLNNDFSLEQKKRNFEYYDPLTTGDSSLSACIQSIVASEIGEHEKAVEYAHYAVLMDLADIGGNMADGCHIASMGGTWMVAVYGFAGMRDGNGEISFNPRLPKSIEELHFPLRVQDRRLKVKMTHQQVTYLLEEGVALEISHQDQSVTLEEGEAQTFKIKP